LHELAAGGMATVYLGRKRGVGGFERLVAVKCCHPHLRRDPAFVAMFLDEARLAARIHHPNVVATLDVSDEDALYFVMEYVEGTSLAEWIARLVPLGQRIPPALLLRVIIDGLGGLHAAHELRDHDGKSFQLVHRDVSPQNILVGLDGGTRIADFGIAKAESRATRTRTGQVKGKTGYMPPEQILGEPLDRRADVYAAGVVLWEALSGRRLFAGDSDAATINLVLSGQIPPPSSVAEVSPGLDSIVLRALKFRADDRFASAAELALALETSGLEIANTAAVGRAVSELFQESVLRRRAEAERRASLLVAVGDRDRTLPSASALGGRAATRLARLPNTWLGAGALVVVALSGLVWGLRERRPVAQAETPTAPASSAPSSMPAPIPCASAPATAATAAAPAGTSGPKPARVARPRRPPLAATRPGVEVVPQAPETVTPPPPPVPRASAPAPRPRTQPSEFRPPEP
jgi:serine/threonine-protein kinase